MKGGKSMNRLRQLVTFSLDDQKFALYVSIVRRIIRVIEVTPLPAAPEIVIGIINLQGQIIPVYDIRLRFHIPVRDIHLSDQMIIADTATRAVALHVDSVDDVIVVPEEMVVTGEHILPDMEYVKGIVKTKDGMILIHDLEQFLSLQEDGALQEAMEALNPG
jgi:purine-binding chemotaxis protein CheW